MNATVSGLPERKGLRARLRQFRGSFIAICCGGLGLLVEGKMSSSDRGTVVANVSIILLASGLGAGIGVQLHDAGRRAWRSWFGGALATAAAGALMLWSFHGHPVKKVEGQNERQARADRLRRMEAAVTRLEQKIDTASLMRRVGADPRVIAEAIGASACAAPFNVAWKLLLVHDKEILSASDRIDEQPVGIKIDWSSVKVMEQTETAVLLQPPRGEGLNAADDARIAAAKTKLCTPEFATRRTHEVEPGGSAHRLQEPFSVGAAVLETSDATSLVIVGLRREGTDPHSAPEPGAEHAPAAPPS